MKKYWTKVDNFLNDSLILKPKSCAWIEHLIENNKIPPIGITPLQGQFLSIIVKSIRANNILEIGTLVGYSTAWLASAIPEHKGVIHTIESREAHIKVAKQSFKHPDLKNKVILHHGSALDVMKKFPKNMFDFIFIDADKSNYSQYLDLSLNISNRNSLIIMDNVIREGEFLNKWNEKKVSIHGLKKLYENIKTRSDIEVSVLQTVGSKGWDGLMLIRKKKKR